MVKSRIHPKDINYDENKDMDEVDDNYASSQYSLSLFGIQVEVVFGKERTDHLEMNIIYYPIYLILNEEVVEKIGVFEIDKNILPKALNEDGDIDLKEGHVLIFIKKKPLMELVNVPIVNELGEIEDIEKGKIEISDETVDIHTNIAEFEDDKEEDVLKVDIPEHKLSSEVKSADESLKDGVFTVNATKIIPPLLQEESKEDKTRENESYTERSKNKWIEKFTRNNNYSVIDNEGEGDCFFAVIRDAFEQIGKDTTVEILRALLAKEATEDVFQEYRGLYNSFTAELQEKEGEIKDMKKLSALLKKRIDSNINKEERQKIIEEAKQLVEKFNRAKKERDGTKEMIDEFEHMEQITDLEKFREFIKSRSYWADTWAISTVEKLLNIKMIILSEEAYGSGDLDSVLKCGQLNDTELESAGQFLPDYYIMTSYTGKHYKLIAYKEKRILKFREIPYDIKAMVINKCMEKNAGPYYIIQDFRDLKNKFGLDAYEGKKEGDEDEFLNKELYDKEVVFKFYEDSNSKPKPGRGSGEEIPQKRITEFNILSQTKEWRKKLDDSWFAPITVDSHRWNSVEHYFLGSQFKKGYPDLYLQFSVDSGSKIASDLKLARDEGGKSGKYKDYQIIQKKIDPDFYEIKANPRHQEERKKALGAKFTQNLDLKSMLLETKMAKLEQFVRRRDPEPDILLMQLRKELMQ